MNGVERPEDIPRSFASDWNAHDMGSFAALFHPDASFVNRFAHHVRGVEAIIDMHRPIHETIYRDSSLANELLSLDQVVDGVAILHFWSRLTTGLAHPAGAHAVDMLILAIVVRHDERWRIKALENVTLTNPRTGEPMLRD